MEHGSKSSIRTKRWLTGCKRREDGRVRDRRAKVPENRSPENAGEAMLKEIHVFTTQPPRQRPHEREHDPHGAEGAAASIGYDVAQNLQGAWRRKDPTRAVDLD